MKNQEQGVREQVYVLIEKDAMKYHLAICWVACVFNPIFSITDYHNIPHIWQYLFAFRLFASAVILGVILMRHKLQLSSFSIILVPFLLICFENTVVYLDIDAKNLEGHNLNFMAMFIASSMFLLWRWTYSLVILVPSFLLTSFFIYLNTKVSYGAFFVDGGLLLIISGMFMAILIQTRYGLTLKTLTATTLLQESNEALEQQTEEIKSINESLEQKVQERTEELLKKNKALEEYAFVNSHQLRSPVSNILGLVELLSLEEVKPEIKHIINHLQDASAKLDTIVKDTTKKLNI